MSKHISELLAKVTMEVLHKQYTPRSAHPLSTRAGTGKRTYHRFDPSKNKSIIVYGQKTVNEKISDPKKVFKYGTSKEIKRFNAFDGKITLQNSIAAVALHEYAHYIQTISGKRYKGSVHNDDFYEILGTLYKEGYGNEVKSFLQKDPVFSELSDEVISPSIKSNYHQTIKVGDWIVFKGKNGKKFTEKVLKVNEKTISTISYRIGFGLIEKHIPKSEAGHLEKSNEKKPSSENINVGDFINFKGRNGENITAKVLKVNIKSVKCTDNKYVYKVPFRLILTDDKNIDPKNKPVIKDREYFSYLKPNDTIYFNNKGKKEKAVIIRLNTKRATCRTNYGDLYIPYSLIMD